MISVLQKQNGLKHSPDQGKDVSGRSLNERSHGCDRSPTRQNNDETDRRETALTDSGLEVCRYTRFSVL